MKDRDDYTIEDYSPEWPETYKKIIQPLVETLGDNFIYCEHVGSTSVPEMKAKPIIDALIVVKNLEDTDKHKEVFEKLGYILRENFIAPNSRVYTKEDRSSIVHILPEGHPNINQFIKIRDALRQNSSLRKEYSNLKKKLKEQHPNNYDAYRAGKEKFLKSIYYTNKER